MRKAFNIGAVIGGILGVIVSFGMDVLLGESIGGGWSKAVANDLYSLFHVRFPDNHIAVYVGVLFAISFVVAIGVFMGGLFCLTIAYFFKTLTKDR
jgi:hypothetical protein